MSSSNVSRSSGEEEDTDLSASDDDSGSEDGDLQIGDTEWEIQETDVTPPKGKKQSLTQKVDGLPARFSNITNDFVGTEAYIVSMDSLFVELCSHEYLDWTSGGQSAVLLEMADRVLQRFVQHGIHVTLVWFSKLDAAFLGHSDLFFHREILKAHLRMSGADGSPKNFKEIKTFSDPSDETWRSFLREESPALAFISNNAVRIDGVEKVEEIKDCLSALVLDVLQNNIPVIDFVGSEANVSTYLAFRKDPMSFLVAVANETKYSSWNKLPCVSQPASASEGSPSQAPKSLAEFWKASLAQLNNGQGAVNDEFVQAVVLYGMVCNIPLTSASQMTMEGSGSGCDKTLLRLFHAGGQMLASFPNIDFPDFSRLLDGRLLSSVFFFVQSCKSSSKVPPEIYEGFHQACTELGVSNVWTADTTGSSSLTQNGLSAETELGSRQKTFQFPLYEKLIGTESAAGASGGTEAETVEATDLFFENYHWHSGKPLEEEIEPKHESLADLEDWQKRRALRAQQNLASWYRFYGETLEGRGNKFKVDFSREMGKKVPEDAASSSKGQKQEQKQRQNPAPKKGGKNTKNPQKMSKAEMKAKNQEDLNKRDTEKEFKKLQQILAMDSANKLLNLARAEEEYQFQENKAKACFHWTNERWKQIAPQNSTENGDGVDMERRREIFLPLFIELKKLLTKYFHHLPEEFQKDAILKWISLGFTIEESGIKEKPLTRLGRMPNVEKSHGLGMSSLEYQLCFAGESFDVRADPEPDPRVQGFEPDEWQRMLLDVVDKKQSALIVAPTSAGKTFASYYCIEKVLREEKEGVVVYVSPTKALVNQVAATVNSRFSDKTLEAGKALLGTFTRDIRHNVRNSHVLMTVPQCLEMLLLSPKNTEWCRRIKYVIFDEVHCIGGGVGDIRGSEVWEHAILLTQAPFLALSATIQNPEKLHQWLKTAESQKGASGRDVALVTSGERYSELQSTIYERKEKCLRKLNPFSVYHFNRLKEFGFSTDQQLTAKEVYQLYCGMERSAEGDQKERIRQSLSPSQFEGFKNKSWLDRADLRKYENDLKKEFLSWLETEEEESERRASVVQEILGEDVDQELKKRSCPSNLDRLALNSAVVLVEHLKSQEMLPALCFSDNRVLCEKFAKRIYKHLKTEEEHFLRKPGNKRRQHEFETHKSGLDRKKKKLQDESAKQGKKSKEEASREASVDDFQSKSSPFSALELGPFTLRRPTVDTDIFEKLCDRIQRKNRKAPNKLKKRSTEFMDLLERGIGFHHSGMPTAHRQAVEILFRAGFLSVVFCTSTLALGIHMPCKTVVLGVDSQYLTPLQYRQMTGRAGRRGFDPKGTVVFLGIGQPKIRRLLMSSLPQLRGSLPITVSFVLRLLSRISGAPDRESVTNSVLNLLQNPFWITFSDENPEKLRGWVKDMFRFSCHLLNKLRLIDTSGQPVGLAGVANHLHYHEPGNMLLVFFLESGAIHDVCKAFPGEENKAQREEMLILILSHLFTKVPTQRSDIGRSFANSKVVLDPLPNAFHLRELLEDYNATVMQSYMDCMGKGNFTEGADTSLCEPMISGGLREHLRSHGLTRQRIQGEVFGLSGREDSEIRDLLRQSFLPPLDAGVFYDTDFLPVKPYPMSDHRGNAIFLNSYALDFWRHEITRALIVDNGLMEGDVYNLLYDFALVIKAVSTALAKIGPEDDIVVQSFEELALDYQDKFRGAYKGAKFL